jgi:hypothetical protein
MRIHNLNEVDKSGFPINEKGEQVPILDREGNAILLLNSNLLVSFSKGFSIKFNPKNTLECRNALDSLVEILANKFDDYVKGNFTLDLTEEAKLKHKVFTQEPLVIPTVQIYFSWINSWLKYLGNCYNIEFKLLFYAKYKERIKNSLIALKTDLNKHEVNKNYLKYADEWLKATSRNIKIEKKSKKIDTVNNNATTLNNDQKIFLIDVNKHFAKEEIFPEIESFVNHFEKNKCININYQGKKYKVYSPGLAYLFTGREINAQNSDSDEIIKLDGHPYFITFAEAFERGEQIFKSDYEVSKEILYGENSKLIVSDIHDSYYHSLNIRGFKGWHSVVNNNPIIFNNKTIDEYGYLSGLLSKANEFIAKYPNLFKDFHNCDTQSNNNQVESKLDKKSILEEQNLLIPKLSIAEVFNHFEILTKTTNRNNEFYLTHKQLLIFIKSTFIDLKPIKQDFNCKGFQKKKVREVFYNFYFANKNKERNQTRIKRKYFDIMNNAFNGFNNNDYTDFAK